MIIKQLWRPCNIWNVTSFWILRWIVLFFLELTTTDWGYFISQSVSRKSIRYIFSCNLSNHCPSSVFGRNVTEEVVSQTMLYFPTLPYSASALPCKTVNTESAQPFHLNGVHCFCQQIHKTIKIITWSQMNHSSFTKWSTMCARHRKQDQVKAHSNHLLCVQSMFTESVMKLVAMPKVGVFLSWSLVWK